MHNLKDMTAYFMGCILANPNNTTKNHKETLKLALEHAEAFVDAFPEREEKGYVEAKEVDPVADLEAGDGVKTLE